MTDRLFACGETLCKKRFSAVLSAAKPWPLPCPECGRSLYPDDILQSSHLENLDQHRGPLMEVVAGKLAPVHSKDLGARPLATSTGSLLDEIADATALVQTRAERPRRNRLALVGALAIGIALVCAYLYWR